MSNMSYCRFENTLADLKDCAENLEEELSEREHKARKKLIETCKDIVDECYDEDEPCGDWDEDYKGDEE
jgi:hypothetical protein